MPSVRLRCSFFDIHQRRLTRRFSSSASHPHVSSHDVGIVCNVDCQRDALPTIHLSLEQLVEDFSELFGRDDWDSLLLPPSHVIAPKRFFTAPGVSPYYASSPDPPEYLRRCCVPACRRGFGPSATRALDNGRRRGKPTFKTPRIDF
jgi:hypothetical protein